MSRADKNIGIAVTYRADDTTDPVTLNGAIGAGEARPSPVLCS
jgi:hypothetical protein